MFSSVSQGRHFYCFLAGALPSDPGNAVINWLLYVGVCFTLMSDLCPGGFQGGRCSFLVKLNQAALTAFAFQRVAFPPVCTFSVSKTSLVKGDSIWRELREHEYLGLS